MSYWKDTKQRIAVVNDAIDYFSTIDSYSRGRVGPRTLHYGSDFKLILQMDIYETKIVYKTDDVTIDLMSFYIDDYKSTGGCFNTNFFSSLSYNYDMSIHQPIEYVAENREVIDEMNNRFSTGYMSEEEHFQYSTLITMPEYDEMYDIYNVIHRAIGEATVRVYFENFENVPLAPDVIMKLFRKGIIDLC